MSDKRLNRVKNSAIWAAYGDAMGFMSELIDEEGSLKWRIGTNKIEHLTKWRRKLGGKFGEILDLPEGCISDDTQLRLATSRAIGPGNKFDVEAFAQIEVPCWRIYALGGGRGTKAAAKNLSRKGTIWACNFFDEKDKSKYIDVGGNGAAMRIQPHVWASSNFDKIEIATAVIKNSIVTHGHLRGILGALFHALSLRQAFVSEKVPAINDMYNAVKDFTLLLDVVNDANELKNFWKPTWERATGIKLEVELKKIVDECNKAIKLIEPYIEKHNSESDYRHVVEVLGGFSASTKGAGTTTAILASYLAIVENKNPENAMLISANTLGSDTDTIATMCGAILGAISDISPKTKVHNQEYIEKEALRIYSISKGEKKRDYFYPDLLSFTHPVATSDYFGIIDNGEKALAGMGTAKILKDIQSKKEKSLFQYSWILLETGQELLINRRIEMKHLQEENLLNKTPHSSNYDKSEEGIKTSPPVQQESLFNQANSSHAENEKAKDPLERVFQEVLKSDFRPDVFGKVFFDIIKQEKGLSLGIGFAAIVAEAYRAKKNKK